jgi:glycerol-3-phosphate dehydrogenase
LQGPTAHHLAHKYGTQAPQVLALSKSDKSLALPLVEGEAPIRAQVVYAMRHEMARTLEDVVARRIGLQLYGWRLAIDAVPLAAALMGHELGWSAEEEQVALEQYVDMVNHRITSAGQQAEPAPAAIRELTLERK